MTLLALIPAAILVFTLYLSWTERDTSSWPDDEYEDFHRDLEP